MGCVKSCPLIATALCVVAIAACKEPERRDLGRRVVEARLTGAPWEAQLMLVADQTTPYRLLTEVLYSCGQAGYANYRLLVLKARD